VNDINVGTLLGGAIISIMGALVAFALTRSAKRGDSDIEQVRDIAKHDGRITAIEQTVVRLEGLQKATNETVQTMLGQIISLQQTLRAGSALDVRASRLVEDIRRLTEDMRRTQTLDHTLLTELHDRVRALELLTKPLPEE
jgi:hypothetical protein